MDDCMAADLAIHLTSAIN